MVSFRDIILSLPIESHGAHRIGVLVIGPPFLIMYANENARRIIGRIKAGAPSGQQGLPGAIIRFCRDARDRLAKARLRREPAAVYLQRSVASATTPLRLRAAVIPPNAAELASHILIIMDEIPSNGIGLDHAVKELSSCFTDHAPKALL